MELSDFLFGAPPPPPAAPSDADLIEYLTYGIASEARRYPGAPFEFFPVGRFVVEIADMRKGCSASGRPYLTIETIVLESTSLALPAGHRGQIMYMLDKPASARSALASLRDLYQRADLTEDDLRAAVTASELNLDSCLFAGATLDVVASTAWGGITKSKIRVWV